MNPEEIIAAIQLVWNDFDGRKTSRVTGTGGQAFEFFPTAITDNIPPLTPELSAAICLLSRFHLDRCADATLGVGEEDRGAMIISDILLHHGMRRTLARWTPTGAPGEVIVPLANEYISEGQADIHLNGVQAGDKVIVVEDLISTGGTMIALIEAVRHTGAEILELFAVGEKTENAGRAKIEAATGLRTKTLVATDLVTADGESRSRVLHVNLGSMPQDLFEAVARAFPEGSCRLGSGEV
jgi:adenine phosphoribosyltransferase